MKSGLKISRIEIEVIPHKEQRYETCGDWFFRKDADLGTGKMVHVLVIRVSDLGDPRYNACVIVHELFEVLLCMHRGITQEQVDRFDMQFEANRKREDDSEPGDDPKAPYRREHLFATGIEKLLACELDIDWTPYEKRVSTLPPLLDL